MLVIPLWFTQHIAMLCPVSMTFVKQLGLVEEWWLLLGFYGTVISLA
ncbi:hypothetical protein [Trichormus variabilis]|nr:hypothetical protein [Trichormus variabilis]MBD2629632.1 hypothetical protein [Trichormus variabilis FACHB-164]